MTDHNKLFRRAGKVAFVSGAARGIGAEVAQARAQAGAKVFVTDVADGGGKATVAAIRKAGGSADCCVHDVTQEAQWENAIAQAKDKLGGLDVLRSEEHTSELQSLMRISYAVFCLKKKNKHNTLPHRPQSR